VLLRFLSPLSKTVAMPRLVVRAVGFVRLDRAAFVVLCGATLLHAVVIALVAMGAAGKEAGDVRGGATDEAVAELIALSALLPSLDADHNRLSPLDRRQLSAAITRLDADGARQGLRVWWADGSLAYRSPGDRRRLSAPSGMRGRPWSVEQQPLDGRPAVLATYLPVLSGGVPGAVLERARPLAPVLADEAAERRGVYAYFGAVGVLVWLGVLPVSLRLARLVAGAWDPRRRRLLKRVARGLADGEFELHYQPKVALASGEIDGVEALVRWRRQGKLIAPGHFLPAVEHSELIRPLTLFVLDAALGQVSDWKREGRTIPVAVNLAPGNLADLRLPHDVEAALGRHHVPASQLTLEVTETAVIEDDAAAGRTLRQLADLGARVSIDDFGTGHSSLSRLSRHPFHELKIDRSFVTELTGLERPMVATIIRLAQSLNLRVVAEGVEDLATLNALRTLGCDVAQGYVLSRPVPAAELPQAIAHLQALSRTAEAVRFLLDEIRVSLGLDAAFVAEFVDDEQVFRFARGGEPFETHDGTTQALDDSYCSRVVAGVFPNLIRDARNQPGARELPVTELRGIGAYIGVPLHRPDGSLYGTLCGLADHSRHDLTDHDVATLASFAERIGPLLDRAHLAASA
jgi:EAL domain-containing protein (putative c-di-GMP-specific phosphodiesterase class I)